MHTYMYAGQSLTLYRKIESKAKKQKKNSDISLVVDGCGEEPNINDSSSSIKIEHQVFVMASGKCNLWDENV